MSSLGPEIHHKGLYNIFVYSMALYIRVVLICAVLIESLSGGFTYHEKTPMISASQINPAQDNNLALEIAVVESAETCPTFPVR